MEKNRFPLAALAVALIWMHAGTATAQTFNLLYYFPANLTNHTSAEPTGGPLVSGNTLYGTTGRGGTNENGSVYAVNTNGTGFTNYHSFASSATNRLGQTTNSDGSGPTGGLVLGGDTLFGTAYGGGSSGNGTVFAINTNGLGFANLHTFAPSPTNALGVATNSEGATPFSGVILSGNALYGTTCYGGTNGNGTVFVMNTNGMGFKTLHTFSILVSSNNSDGANPYAGLLLSGEALYGITQFGGTNGSGALFAINTNGTGFTNLHNFALERRDSHNNPTNYDGANARAWLIQAGTTLYGTATFGGINGYGTVFAINTNGTGFSIVHYFGAGGTNSMFQFTNSDGAYPQGGVTLSGTNLYGTAEFGGGTGLGTLYSVNTNGASFTVIEQFAGLAFDPAFLTETNRNGTYPQSALYLAAGILYGSAPLGGLGASGTLFSVAVGQALTTPPLSITHSGTNVVIAWPTNYTGFTLQSTTNLAVPRVWGNVSPAAVIVDGQYVVTNNSAVPHSFYRLDQ